METQSVADECRAFADAYWKREDAKIDNFFDQSLFVDKQKCFDALIEYIATESKQGKYSTKVKRGIHETYSSDKVPVLEEIVREAYCFVNEERVPRSEQYVYDKFVAWLNSELTNFLEEFTRLTKIATKYEIHGNRTTHVCFILHFSWEKK